MRRRAGLPGRLGAAEGQRQSTRCRRSFIDIHQPGGGDSADAMLSASAGTKCRGQPRDLYVALFLHEDWPVKGFVGSGADSATDAVVNIATRDVTKTLDHRATVYLRGDRWILDR